MTATYRRMPVVWPFWLLLVATVVGLYLIVRYPTTLPPTLPAEAATNAVAVPE